ncbi:hypothetical protein [Thiocapsa sp.]|uniref:hypothetical protein n=1 Tax=Thiocapsa sp. TaxID=2024551 RepID=UPI0025D2F8FB|nr:hypothetical protein [Thiocapsa sp.]
MVIAHEGLFRLQLGLGVALALSVILGLTGIHRGVILWAGLVFFSLASIAVIGFPDLWTIRHMGVLAAGMLATATWFSVLIRKPFTLDYARAHTDRSLWSRRWRRERPGISAHELHPHLGLGHDLYAQRPAGLRQDRIRPAPALAVRDHQLCAAGLWRDPDHLVSELGQVPRDAHRACAGE